MKQGGKGGARGWREVHTKYWWGNLKESYQFEDLSVTRGDRGGTVLCYKSEGRWFDPSWCLWNFSLT